MTLRDLVTDNEYNMLSDLRYNIHYRHHNGVDSYNWLIHWENAKNNMQKTFPHLFTNNLILSKPITYMQDIDEITNKIYNRMYPYDNQETNFTRFFNELKNKIIIPYVEKEDEKYFHLHHMHIPYDISKDFYALWDCYFLATNTYQGHTFEIPTPNGKLLKVEDGCKLSKALGKIATAFNIPNWEEVRIQLSQILNNKKVTGTLHLSIHPLDYLTASVNNCRWESCMNIYGGDYRRGVIEMMNSPMVIVGYITGKEDTMPFECGRWNNKKWREFFIINEHFISGVKGYPYWNRDLEAECINWLKELTPEFCWSDIYKECIGSQSITFDTHNGSVTIGSPYTGEAMYNDFYDDNNYQLCINLDSPNDETYFPYHAEYSGYSQCICCLEEVHNEYHEPSELVCDVCDERVSCYKCNNRCEDDDVYYINGHSYCSYCADHLSCCTECGTMFDPEELEECGITPFDPHNLHIIFKIPEVDNQFESTNHEFSFCEDCARKYLNFDATIYYAEKENETSWWRGYERCILIDDIFDEEFKEHILNNFRKDKTHRVKIDET